MGCCFCKKEKYEDYEFRQTEKLKDKIDAYSNGKIDRYNIVRNVAFGMLQVAKKKLSGQKKKELVVNTILEIMDKNALPAEIAKTFIENIVEDIFATFTKAFKKRCC